MLLDSLQPTPYFYLLWLSSFLYSTSTTSTMQSITLFQLLPLEIWFRQSNDVVEDLSLVAPEIHRRYYAEYPANNPYRYESYLLALKSNRYSGV